MSDLCSSDDRPNHDGQWLMRPGRWLAAHDLSAALLVGLVCVLPHLLIPAFQAAAGLPEGYSSIVAVGVNPLVFDETDPYASGVMQAFSGRWWPGDLYCYEYRNTLSPMPAHFINALMGLLCRAVGSVEVGFRVADFLFPALLYLLVLGLARQLLPDRELSSPASFAFVLGYTFWYHWPPWNLMKLASLWSQFADYASGTRQVEIVRTITPEVTLPVLIAAAWLLNRALQPASRPRWVLGAGVACGLLFYSYFFFWSFQLAALGLLAVHAVIRRDRTTLVRLGCIFGIALVVGIPYWRDFFAFNAQPYAGDVKARFGLEYGRFSGVKPAIKCALVWIAFRLFGGGEAFPYLLTNYLLAGLACMNVQLLTGYSLQPWHWETRIVHPWCSLLLVAACCPWARTDRRRSGRMLRTILLLFGPVLLLWVGYTHARFSATQYAAYRLPGGLSACFQWLDGNAGRQAAVLTNSFEVNMLLCAHTRCYRYHPSVFSTISTRELLDRCWTAFKLFGVPAEKVDRLMAASPDVMRAAQPQHFLYTREQLDDHWQFFFLCRLYFSQEFPYYALPEEVRRRFLDEFRRHPTEPRELAERYRMDYVLWTPRDAELATVSPDRMANLFELVFKAEPYSVYRVKRSAGGRSGVSSAQRQAASRQTL